MEHNLLIFGLNNQTSLLIFMGVLIAFIVLLTTLGIVFIVALRKRRPVVKVVMAPQAIEDRDEEKEQPKAPVAAEPEPAPVAVAKPAPEPAPVEEATEEAPVEEKAEEPATIEEATAEAPEAEDEAVIEEPVSVEEAKEEEPVVEEAVAEEAVAEETVPEMLAPLADEEYVVEGDEDDDDGPTFITEGHERVRYNRSFMAKLCQLSNESKEWYSALKNNILSYNKVKARMSWKRESFRLGRMTVARLIIRGKTLCLLLAVEPAGYAGTKYKVEDVSNASNTMDTPTLYRIKNERRLKYAIELVAGLMTELKVYKKPNYEPHDYFVPYEGDMSLMQRGLVKRVVTGSTRIFKVEEVDLNNTNVDAVEAESAPAFEEAVEPETEIAAVAETETVEETVEENTEEVLPIEEAEEEVAEVEEEVAEEAELEAEEEATEEPEAEEEVVEETEPEIEEEVTEVEEEVAEEAEPETEEEATEEPEAEEVTEETESEVKEEVDDEFEAELEEEVPEETESETEEVAEEEVEKFEPEIQEEFVYVHGKSGESDSSYNAEEYAEYNSAFMEKYNQLSDEYKEWYSNIKNELLSYDNIKVSSKWKSESHHANHSTLVRLVIRNNTIYLLLAANPDIYAKYEVQNLSKSSDVGDTPTLYGIKSELQLANAKEMIAHFMQEINIIKGESNESADPVISQSEDSSEEQSEIAVTSEQEVTVEDGNPVEEANADNGEGEN